MTPEDLAQLILGLREKYGIPQNVLAAEFKVSRGILSDWEHGRRLNRISEFLTVLEGLGVQLKVTGDVEPGLLVKSRPVKSVQAGRPRRSWLESWDQDLGPG